MILERAQIDLVPGSEQEFESALDRARAVLEEARGFRSLSVARGVENPSRYLLLIEWETLEDHVVGFRGSDLFVRWRQLIGPYFAAPPLVEHFAVEGG
jgi:heme-degrading monooxygenase HmoA